MLWPSRGASHLRIAIAHQTRHFSCTGLREPLAVPLVKPIGPPDEGEGLVGGALLHPFLVWCPRGWPWHPREFEDLKNDKVITTVQFKQRVSQLLTSYGYVKPGKKHSYLENLLRGMPKRLMRCKQNRYGNCGK